MENANLHIDIVVVGASAGGVKPLMRLWECLPDDLAAAFFVATHRTLPHSLVEILRHISSLSVESAEDGGKIKRGKTYVCPADYNLTLEYGHMRVDRSPPERFRPSINALFRSAASVYGRRVAGVLLSGLAEDGVAGLWQIKARGGLTIIQDPEEAEFSSMPRSAIANVMVDDVLPVEEIASKLVSLTKRRADEPRSPIKVLIVEDENLVADDVSQGLQRRGYSITGKVRSGESAFKSITVECPDVVLMDIRLAGSISGTEAARIIWERFQIPVVFLTAYSDSETLGEVKASGGYGFVMKPFRSDAVHAAVELALDRRQRELAF